MRPKVCANKIDYIRSFGGLQREVDYPYVSGYTSKTGGCNANKTLIEETTRGFSGYFRAGQLGSSSKVKKMRNILALHGPIVVWVCVSDAFTYHWGGIMTDDKCNEDCEYWRILLLVGYGTDKHSGLDYWILKNSWGTDWGQNGYIYVERRDQSNCGIEKFPLIAI